MSLNKFMGIGNLGRDPELRYTPSGVPVCTFSVAISRRYRVNDETREETEWVNCVAWNRLAETCSQYLHKGDKVYVEGRLQTRSWEGQDGQKRYRTEVILEGMQMLSQRREPAETGAEAESVPDDEIPF